MYKNERAKKCLRSSYSPFCVSYNESRDHDVSHVSDDVVQGYVENKNKQRKARSASLARSNPINAGMPRSSTDLDLTPGNPTHPS